MHLMVSKDFQEQNSAIPKVLDNSIPGPFVSPLIPPILEK